MDAVRNIFDNSTVETFYSLLYFRRWQPTRCNRPDFFRKLLRIREFVWVFVMMRRKKKGGGCSRPLLISNLSGVDQLEAQSDHSLNNAVADGVCSSAKYDAAVVLARSRVIECEIQPWIARNKCKVRMIQEIVG